MRDWGGSGGALALATKLLHPRPKAIGVEQQSAEFETGRNFRFERWPRVTEITSNMRSVYRRLAPCRSQSEYHLGDATGKDVSPSGLRGSQLGLCLSMPYRITHLQQQAFARWHSIARWSDESIQSSGERFRDVRVVAVPNR